MRADDKTGAARRLRRDATAAEALLWRRLRARGLGGAKFRQQHPLGPFVVDFVCLEARLVVELDGGQHDRDTEAVSARTRLLRGRGVRVLRFWNGEVAEDVEGGLGVIEGALGAGDVGGRVKALTLPPALARRRAPPSPAGAGEGKQGAAELPLARLREREGPGA